MIAIFLKGIKTVMFQSWIMWYYLNKIQGDSKCTVQCLIAIIKAVFINNKPNNVIGRSTLQKCRLLHTFSWRRFFANQSLCIIRFTHRFVWRNSPCNEIIYVRKSRKSFLNQSRQQISFLICFEQALHLTMYKYNSVSRVLKVYSWW
jgi:hypothetical protein